MSNKNKGNRETRKPKKDKKAGPVVSSSAAVDAIRGTAQTRK